jgi:hypothetical protein
LQIEKKRWGSTRDAEAKAHRLENEMRKLDTWYNPVSRPTMDRQNQIEDDSDSVTESLVHNNGLTSDLWAKIFKEAWDGDERKWKPWWEVKSWTF